MKLVTVIVPVYKVEKYLKRCVESVQQQTYENLEIVIVDDGSPDNCPKMCDDFAVFDKRIKVVHKENGGLGYARNSGLSVATGDYVTFVDSDDWISKDHIENLVNEIERQSADVVIGAYTVVETSGVYTPCRLTLAEGVYENEKITTDIILPLIGPDVDYPNDVQINASCWANLYRRDIIEQNGIEFINERHALSEDIFFNLEFLSPSKRVAVINELGYYYFESDSSITRKYDPKSISRAINFYTMLCERTEKHGLTDKIEHRIERSFLLKIRFALKLLVRSKLSRKAKIAEIKAILSNEFVVRVLSCYPIDTFIPAMRVLVKAMKNQNVFAVYNLLKFREVVRRVSFLKHIFKKFGIGK